LPRLCRDAFRRVTAPADVDLDGATFGPAQFLKSLQERCYPRPRFCVVGGSHENSDQRHTLWLLRPHRPRPRSRAAEQRDELSAFHSITSSARASRIDGTSRPSALAVLRLIMSSNPVACWTGRSPGFAPFRIRST